MVQYKRVLFLHFFYNMQNLPVIVYDSFSNLVLDIPVSFPKHPYQTLFLSHNINFPSIPPSIGAKCGRSIFIEKETCCLMILTKKLGKRYQTRYPSTNQKINPMIPHIPAIEHCPLRGPFSRIIYGFLLC